MRIRVALAAVCLLWYSIAFAQSDRGTITGTISDPGGAVVANAPVQVRNVDTGAVFQVGSTATGNYVVQLPTGTYQLDVTVPGFKTYVRQGLTVPVAQTLRVDVTLEVGAASESVTVTEAAPLLKTESGELSHNVTTETMNSLPVLGIGASAGSAGLRNPYAVLQLLPGSDWHADSSVRLNGMPSNTQTLRIEGQDSTSGISSSTQSTVQPSVDAIQEFAIQTSNYAAEFGQAGGGVFNITMKSGSNQLHGTGYDYFVNEDLNAGQPFTSSGNGHLLRPRQRRNDYGFTVGGPLVIPHVYNGHDKTFFFFNFEQFRETVITNNIPKTVPTLAYRTGNFSQALTNRVLGTDPFGRQLLENTIYDPKTDRIVNGLRERDPFPNNTIPMSQLDPVSLKVQAFVPLPTSTALVNNYLPVYANPKTSDIPSVKIDQELGPRAKLSGYWARTAITTPNADGLPSPITTSLGTSLRTQTVRINFDYTLQPTLLLHVGVGLIDTVSDPQVTDFDNSTIGLKGTNSNLFPTFQTMSNAQGGLSNIGPGTLLKLTNYKPTANVSLTWVRNNHTFKAGGELGVQGYIAKSRSYTASWMVFNPNETGLPALNGVSLPSTVGFNYASFLLGAPDSGYIAVPSTTRLGNHGLAGFVQDSWKVTRKFTVDYGLRYDFETYLREHNGYMPNVSIATPNPATAGLPGAIIFEGNGPGRCGCQFANNYPWAFGPRVGAAYQINTKTVLRLGAGISYGHSNANNNKSANAGSSNPYNTVSYGDPAFHIQDGIPYKVTFPNFDPGQLPLAGTIGNPTNFIDQNAGRPSRVIQWSLGLQREVMRNLLVEATYVGNRGVWWQANTMTNPNALTPQRLAGAGLSLNNPDDLKLLASPLNSALAASRNFNHQPYPGFPVTATVAQSLRLMPGYLTLVNTWPPLGDTWYESLQVKATKRLSHGLDFNYSLTWSKQLTIGAEQDFSYFTFVTPAVNDANNRRVNKDLSAFDQPLLSVISANYTTPRQSLNKGFAGKAASWIARDWQVGAVLRYASGLPIQVPAATTNLSAYVFQNTFVNRVPNVPLFTHDLNCHCFDPNTTFVFNSAAWTNPPLGQFGTAAAYYTDYRYQRRPSESMSLGRIFRIKERATFQIRAEFTNIFNRTEVNNPTATNAFATPTKNNAGQNTAGFGWINTSTTFATPRQGTLIARITF
jgi:hypothetical protein